MHQADCSRSKRLKMKIIIWALKEPTLDKDWIDVANLATSKVKNHHRIQM